MNLPNRTAARSAVVTALERLRAEFPLEQHLTSADADVRHAYARVLEHWRQGRVPPPDLISAETRDRLIRLDAITVDDGGIGCYPFSVHDTGNRVQFRDHAVQAMCAIDALAIARLVEATTSIDTTCQHCRTAIRLRVERDGSLDHDQVDRAQVAWLAGNAPARSCSEGLCRALRFLCPACRPPAGGTVFTLPQAAAIGNAFFGFQRTLLQAMTGNAA